jgi:hypothetical protein
MQILTRNQSSILNVQSAILQIKNGQNNYKN